jgi:hypothetical protein
MAVVMQMHWPEFTLDNYEEARRKVAWERAVPRGVIFHVAWMADDGFHAVDVWESGDQHAQFMQDRLMPVVAGEMGITSQPVITVTDTHTHCGTGF